MGENADSGSKDMRNLLVVLIAQVAIALAPRVIVVENVRAFLTRRVRHPHTMEAVSGAVLLISLLKEEYVALPLVSDLAGGAAFEEERAQQFVTALASMGGACLARAPLGVADSGVAGEIDPDSRHALPAQCPLAHRGQQERLHAHVQPGLQFLMCAAGSGLADEASHRGGQGAIAGEMHAAQREQPVAVEAQGVTVRVVAAVVVVAAQMADLLEVAKGGGARGIAERGLELGEGDGGAGSQPGSQHVGGALGHIDTVYLKVIELDMLYQTGGGN